VLRSHVLQARKTLEVEVAPLLAPAPSGAPRQQQQQQGVPPSHEDEPIDWLATSLLFLFPALGGLLFGYDIGATSGVRGCQWAGWVTGVG